MRDSSSLNHQGLLEFSDVTVMRGGTRILDRLSLSIPISQHTVILGPNGSGKTSLLKLLIRQFYPSVDDGQSGSVRILGQSVWNVAELRKHLGIVSGELDWEFAAPRSGRMTGLEAVLSGLDGVQLVSRISSFDDQSIAVAREALQRSGAEDLEQQSLATMSTGQRRRVLIARALVHRPAALVLDEPTTGLDVAARYRFLDSIQRLAVTGITMILVTHHIEEIFPAIQRCVFLKKGRVHRDGPCDSLIRDEPLSDLFEFALTVQREGAAGRYSLMCQ